MATYYMYFLFLTCEVKCSAAAHDIADQQNAHSVTLVVILCLDSKSRYPVRKWLTGGKWLRCMRVGAPLWHPASVGVQGQYLVTVVRV